jgi:hypothetical protein
MSKTARRPARRIRVPTVKDFADEATRRRVYETGRRYTSATENAAKMYATEPWEARYARAMRIDRSGGRN